VKGEENHDEEDYRNPADRDHAADSGIRGIR
jgi:hypothetical protein